jgi:hypothetical protein
MIIDMIKRQNIEGNDKVVSEIENGRATTGCAPAAEKQDFQSEMS